MTTNSRTARKKQKKTKKKPVWKNIFRSLLILIIVGCVAIGGYFTYAIVTAPDLDPDKLDVPYSAQFYDMNGDAFADIGKENRIKIKYDDLPKELIDAVTATEDVRFFEHHGIDLRRIAGAIKANFQRGFGAEGASTITQQVVEKMFLTPEKSLKLKIQEQWLALKLEREYSKQEILEMYLNKIFYGSNAYGVAKAAEVYFGKNDLHDLTLLESAMLAGLPQRPTAYNPFENPDLMQGRVDTVLKLMVRHGKVSQAEADEAQAEDVSSVLTEKKPLVSSYDAFMNKAKLELEEKLPDVDIYSTGLKVYTTIDTKAQEHVEFLLTDSDDNPIPFPNDELRTGITVTDTKTGAIRAIGGGRNRKSGDLNYAINPKGMQPGSVFKPLVAYGPAIEYEKWSTYHQINDDKPFEHGTSNQIRNWNKKYGGWMSIRYALKESLNVPAAKTLDEIGSDRAKEFAEGLGITFANEHLDPRDAIGGTDTNTTPMQLAGAYSAFGNEGIYTEPYAVTKVEFPDGSTVDLKPESEVAMSDYTAYMVTDMLKDVVSSGTGTNANISGLPVAGKTGTTNVEGEEQGSNNAWFAGYTTNYTIAVWSGYDQYDRIVEDTQIPLYLFKNIMTELSKDKDTADFVKPDSVVEVAVEKGSNPAALPSDFTPSENIVTELFVKGTEPNTVSEKFDKLDPVSNLVAKYDEEKSAIDITWDYGEEEDISFVVSYKMDDGEMKELTNTEDKAVTLAAVEEGKTYTIQVVAVNSENKMESEPSSTTVDLIKKEEEIPGVSDLDATYNDEKDAIDVSWNYDGPTAAFEVDINGSKQTVQSHSVQINGVTPGETYKIIVTPLVDDKHGKASEVSITIDEKPDENNNGTDEDEDNGADDEQPVDGDNEEPDNGSIDQNNDDEE